MHHRLPFLTFCMIGFLSLTAVGQSSQIDNKYIDSLKSKLPSVMDSARVDLLNQIAYNYYYYNLDSTDDYALKSIELSSSINYLKGLSEAQRMMGISAKAQNKETEAYSWLLKGLETAESINDYQGIADNLNSIGIFFSYVEDFTRAINYFKKSVKNQILARNRLREGILYANIGDIFQKQNNLDSARHYFEKSKFILDSIGDGRWEAMIFSLYGNLLIKSGDLDNAESYSLKALELSKEHGQTMHLRRSYQNLAEIYFQRNELRKSLNMARLALSKSEEIGFFPYLIEDNEILYRIYKLLKNNEEALYYHEQYSQYRDSLRFDQLNSEAELLAFQVELEKIEEENQALRMENETQEAQNEAWQNIIQKQNTVTIGISVILIIVTALAIVLFRLRLRERETNNKLLETNKDLEDQKEELSATLKMVEHLNAQLQAQNNALNQSAIVSFTDLEGNIISVNNNFCTATGYEREDLIGKNKRILTSGEHPKELFSEMWETIKAGNTWRGELKNIKKDGNFFWVDTAIAPVFDDNDKPKQFFSLQFEITKRKNYLNELTEKSHELEDLNKLKDQLLSIVSHDFRSPLNSLQGTLNLMLRGAITQDEFKMLTHSLVDKLDHTYSLLENLLSWAKSQMQGMKVYPKIVNLCVVAEDCTHLLEPIAEKKMISIQNRIKHQIDVFADNEMVKLVLRNLLSNAIKFSHSRSNIILDSLAENGQVMVSVKDHGLGISNENQAKIFKYDNVSTYGTSNEKGMGLGLLLCKDFIERNGGKIWFESELEKGSTFYFSLPTKDNSSE